VCDEISAEEVKIKEAPETVSIFSANLTKDINYRNVKERQQRRKPKIGKISFKNIR
jgi:hypothetical protein